MLELKFTVKQSDVLGMRLRDIEEFSSCLAEGFLADKIYGKRSYTRAKLYVESIKRGREAIQSEKISLTNIEDMDRYIRFLTWLRIHYGNIIVHSDMEAEAFFYNKLIDISSDTEDFKLFWRWLCKVTLAEGGRLLDF